MNHTYLLADDGRGVDSGEGEVHVGGDHGGVVLVLRLEAAGLGSSSRSKLGVQADLQSGHQLGKVRLFSFFTQDPGDITAYLVHNIHSGVETVVCGPFLSESHPQVLHLVLGLQVPGNLPSLHVGVPAGGELHPGVGLGLHLQLDETKVVSLAEHIVGLLAEVSILRWGHLQVLVITS